MASTAGRDRLRAYLEDVLERLSAEDFEPDEEELRSNIMPSIGRSVRRLLAGAPESIVSGIRGVLTDAAVLPNYEADLDAFRVALSACVEQVSSHEPQVDSDGGEGTETSGADDLKPSSDELESYAAVVARLWEVDTPYRLEPGKHFRLNPQSRAASLDDLSDRCREPFFEFVDSERLMANPISDSFVQLLDNYEREEGQSEIITQQERREMDRFLRILMRSPHMKYAHKVLVAWGAAPPSPERFAAKVYDIWFTPYSPKGRGPKSSSGFEHVFVGEEKLDRDSGERRVTGLHNWLQFWRLERNGSVDYLGYTGALDRDHSSIVSVRFSWDDGDDAGEEIKPVSTFLVGTSVAFEFAVLTIAFLGYHGEAGQGGVMFGDAGPVTVKTWPWKTSLGSLVRSAYVDT